MGRKPKVLTKEQQRLVDNVTALNERRRREEPLIYKRIKEQVQEEMQSLLNAEDLAVREAVTAGVPLAEFRRKESGLHTTDTGAVLRSLKRTEAIAETLAETTTQAPEGPYRIDGDGYLVVTPPADELAVMVAEINRTAAAFEPDTVIPSDARFTVTKWDMLDPVDGTTIPGTIDPNPAVKWAKRSQNQAAAVAWFKDQQEAAA